MAYRLTPSSSQSSLSASNSSLYEPERRPPDSPPSGTTSSASSSSAVKTNAAQSAGEEQSESSSAATFTIKRRKKKKPPLTRSATIDDPSSSSHHPSLKTGVTGAPSAAAPPAVSPSIPTGASFDSATPATVPTFEIEDLRLAFSLMDTNKDGRISCSEMWETLAAFGFSSSFSANDIQQILRSASDGQDSMSEAEFISWITSMIASHSSFAQSLASSLKNKRSGSSPAVVVPQVARSASTTTGPSHDPELEQDLRAAFAVFDTDSNGFLSRSELRSALRVLREEDMTEEEVDRFIRSADRDGDGEIGIEDFFSAILSHPP